ncbi:hypothetical protein ASG75_15330 [Rhodanobacter sp. Soil772]|nr:hypothetical protein ASG75_15330 [Rhodanobacter sp. Soil772]
MTIGSFTFFLASRTRGLRGSLQANRLQAENGVRLLATTRMHDWIIDPMVDMLGEGRMELADEFMERMRAYSRARRR